MFVFQNGVCISRVLLHWCTTPPRHGSTGMLQLQLWEAGTTQQSGTFKSFLPCLFYLRRSQVPDPEALQFASMLTNLPETTWTSKFGGSQITSPVLPRGTRLVKRRDISTVIKGHRVSHRGPLSRESEREMWAFLSGLSIHFTPCHQREEEARERETKLVISSLGYPKMIAVQSVWSRPWLTLSHCTRQHGRGQMSEKESKLESSSHCLLSV